MSKTNKLSCPRCGSNRFNRARRARGWWIDQISVASGRPVEVRGSDDLGSVFIDPDPKTVVCEGCGRRAPNPMLP